MQRVIGPFNHVDVYGVAVRRTYRLRIIHVCRKRDAGRAAVTHVRISLSTVARTRMADPNEFCTAFFPRIARYTAGLLSIELSERIFPKTRNGGSPRVIVTKRMTDERVKYKL